MHMTGKVKGDIFLKNIMQFEPIYCFLNKALGDKGSIPESFVKQRSTTRQMIMHEIAFCTVTHKT